MPLAYAEIYVMLGRLFWTFPLGLKAVGEEGGTTVETMRDYEDYFSSYHPYAKREDWFRAVMDKGRWKLLLILMKQ
jgi:hypothetical protein